MIRRVLKNKLVSLGYATSFVESKMKELSISVDVSKYTESELQKKIEVRMFEKPTAEIPRFFLNIQGNLIDKFVFDGQVNVFTKFSIVGSQLSLVDYPLSEKLCAIGFTKESDIIILLYVPNRDTTVRYANKTYEDIYNADREAIVGDYMDALTAGNRLSNGKARDIIYVLLSEFVIDTILVENSNPKLKLYDSAAKFADVITNFEFKYINRRINRIEYVEKGIKTRYLGAGVHIGNLSNDPYLLLNEVNDFPDFSLNRPAYVWFAPNVRGQEEIAIYTASENFPQSTYKEFILNKDDVELRKEADKLTMQFSNEAGYQVSREYILGVIKKLNRQLIILPMDFIRANTAESYEYIEPLRYRFSVIKNRKEFENVLYNSIDDNLNGRYRYRFVEKLSGIYTTIGNKLNYTAPNGKVVKKQSVADFNINFNAAVVKRETLIDVRSIPQLLGYMYKDMDDIGTDMLPVPSIEVVFYFPDINAIGQDVEMYNGTSVEIAKGDGTTAFYEIGATPLHQTRAVRPKDPNEKYVVVKYVNSDGEILKENVIRDVVVGSVFVPEMLPIINDREGKEWYCEPNQVLSLNVSADNSKNEIEVKYLRRMARVRINYINKQGAELNPPVIKNMQVGELFPLETVRKFIDSKKAEWNLYQSKPNKLIISEDDSANVLTLVYDVIKADVYVYYQTRDGRELQPSSKKVAVASKNFSAEIPPTIIEQDGLLWKYAVDSKSTIYVEENELNTIILLYDEVKKKAVTRFVNEDGQKIKDDIVELVQVGKLVEPTYENEYTDIYHKKWKFKGISKPNMKVAENEEENIIVINYEKVLSNIIISMVNESEQRIRDDLIQKAQIGSQYKPSAIKEIEDTYGKYWVCVEESKALNVTESEVSNRITYHYKPLITTVYTQYVDVEGNQLLPQKEKEIQAGSIVVPEFIASLQGKDQRSWILSSNNIKEYKTKKHKEENIIKINYDKKLVDISLSFKDIRGNVLKSDVTIQEQLGSEFKSGIYEKITSDNGERWMVTRTEPERMFVRDGSHFILIYDEIKAKVIVKCINISDSKSIIDDIAITTKLGGVYVPNIQSKIVDKLKRRWTYVGEPGMSLIAKENEQENIVMLKYEPDRANVTLRYLNKNQQMVHEDVVTAEQIGAEIAIKEYDKLFEEDGLGWKLKNMTKHTLIVDEDPDKNVVISNYEPLMVPVATQYIDEEINEITESKIDNIQVGKIFNAVILPRVTDPQGRIWIYSNIKTVELKVKDEEGNKVNIKYLPLKKKVTQKFVNLQNESLIQDKTEDIQVGETYTLNKQERVIDPEDKSWIYKKSSAEKIKVAEEEEKNIITNYYDKELTTVTIKYQTDEGETLEKDKVLELQIGSIYTIEPKETLDDKNKLTWIVSKENKLKVKIAREREKNTYIVVYEKYMVNVYDKYINEATDKEIIKPTITKHQVGSSYLVKVKESIVDEDGKHWVQAAKSDVKIFTSSYKVEPITVIREEEKNVTIVKYKPKLVETTIKYQDPVGKTIRTEEVKMLQVGSIFSESIPEKIVDNFGNRWTYNPNSNSDVKISENPKENIVVLAYEESKGTVTFQYLDKEGNELQKSTKKLVQIGNVYTPQFEMIITDEEGCVWEYAERNVEKLEVKEADEDNILKLIYDPLKVEVQILMVDLWDNEITKLQKVTAQLGSKFKPTVQASYTNEKSLLYKFVKMQPESIVVKEIPISSANNPNRFKFVYEPVNSDVVVIYQDVDGNALRNEERVHLQVGSRYIPEAKEFIKDKNGNEWQLIKGNTDEIVVKENESENIIRYNYEVAKADIIIRYLSLEGIVIQPEKRVSQQVGSEYVPSPEKFVLDKENKKWKLLRVQPVNLRVGSINNVVTITYQEEKAKVTWKYCDEMGRTLKADERHEAQIGLRYTPTVSNKVIYDASQIWRLAKIDPNEIIISENPDENVIKLIYSNTKVEEKKEEKKEIYNPFANTLSPEEEEQLEKDLKAREAARAGQRPSTQQEVVTPKVEETPKIQQEVVTPKVEETPKIQQEVVTPKVEEKPKAQQEVVTPKVEETPKIQQEVVTPKVEETPKIQQEVVTPKVEETPKIQQEVVAPKVEQRPNVGVATQIDNTDDIAVEFKSKELQELERKMSLTNTEKRIINELDDLNNQIAKELNNSKSAYYSGQELYDYGKVEEIILKEKETVRNNLQRLAAQDYSGARLLKIFEHIMASQSADTTFGRLQQRKAVLITDYFIDKPLEDMDKILYICERGKNRIEIELVNKLLKTKLKNPNEAIELKTRLYYKKIMLDNYYKARNDANDNYFVDPNVKASALPDIVVGVTNLLVKQALNILSKENINLALRNELAAIIELCTPQQMGTIKTEIEKFDGRQKRIANKTLQEIEKSRR